MPAPAPVEPRLHVQRGGGHVEQAVHGADPAVLLVGVLPVGDAGDGRTQAGQDAHPERAGGEPGGVDDLGGGLPGQHAQRVQRHRGAERAAGQRRQRRVHRVTEPDPVERVGDGVAGAAQPVVGEAEQVFEPVARPVHPLLAADRRHHLRSDLLQSTRSWSTHHDTSPFSRRQADGDHHAEPNGYPLTRRAHMRGMADVNNRNCGVAAFDCVQPVN